MGVSTRVDAADHILTITIDRPEAMNALDPPAHAELSEIFNRFASDPALWVAIITGSGDRAFSAGNDLRYLARTPPEERIPFPTTGLGGITARFDLTKPVIAAVNGVAMGGGFEIALACDLIIAADTAIFALPEPLVGVAAIAGGIHRLTRMIPFKQAMGMLLTGRSVTAAEGAAMGFVNEVVAPSELMDAARRWASAIIKGSPLAVRATKEMALDGQAYATVAQALAAAYPALDRLCSSQDFLEGPIAFAQKRPPVWSGA
jgi:enoyl-CoA hydratase/carnithine racemase